MPFPRLRTLAVAASSLAIASTATFDAHAFCGFYVSGADAKLFADATQVVLMREGTRTVLSMQNDYKGPPSSFAMVVPVPVVLQKENVKTLPRDVFDMVDSLSAPRLVEYWEQDPCNASGGRGEGIGLGAIGTLGHGAGSGGTATETTVKVEARFAVGEYEIVILSASDSSGLDRWLRGNGYKIPDGAEPVLRPYVQAGSKFFVAKVDTSKVKFEQGRATLSPLRFHYDSDKFELPVRLGLLNSAGTQDIVVNVIGRSRYETANYPNVTVPTNLDVSENAREKFGSFYAALFDDTVAKNPGAVVTEYAWGTNACDPCPGAVQGLTLDAMATLGLDVLPAGKNTTGASPFPRVMVGGAKVEGALPKEVVQRIARQNMGRYRICYERGLQKNPSLTGKLILRFEVDRKGSVTIAGDEGSDVDKEVVACAAKATMSLSMPEADAKTVVHLPLTLSVGSSMPGGAAAGFVLTRLHARYGKDGAGQDLVFKEAEGITGGRETGTPAENGATPSPDNHFQARYAIRHPWTGPVACGDPRRGVWGGPPAGVTAAPATPAKNVAYAPRDVSLASFVRKASADIVIPMPSASAAKPDGGPTAAAPSASKCGCRTAGAGQDPGLGGLALVGAAAILAARRKRALRR